MPAPAPMTDDGRIRSINPRSWEVLATHEVFPTGQLAAAAAECREAQRAWEAKGFAHRKRVLKRVLDRLVQQGDVLSRCIHDEHGKSTAEAMFSEVLGAAEVLKTHLKLDGKWLQPEAVAMDPLSYPGKKAHIEHRPRGVLALITPWNYPLALPMRTLVPALLAGNGVLFKPSEHSLQVAGALVGLFEGLLPRGLLQFLPGGGELGAALSSSPKVDAIVFTGSVATGRAVSRAAAEHLTPVSVELGGKDAAIVCADANLERTAAGVAWGAFHNTGQNCAAIERVYVEDVVYEAFVDLLRKETEALRTGGDADCAEVGPLCTQVQFDTVQRQLDEAVRGGARVICGGQPTGEGWGFQPTLVDSVPAAAALVTDETFGPVLPLVRVASVYEAVDEVNRSPFGLSASVWGKDLGRAEAIARRCDVGMALVNNHAFTGSLPNAPWVGTKASGSGVTGSHLAMKFLTRPQLVVLDKSKAKEVWWFPLNPTALAMGKTVLASITAGLLERLSLTVRLIGLLGKRWSA